jgi:hypothetical protein
VANYDAATIQRYLQKGSFEYNIGDELTILPGVEYMVVAFAFNETFISGLGRKDFRAQDMVAQNDFKVEMETIWLGSTRAHMLFTPNDTTKPYSYWYVEKSFIDGYSNMNEAVQAAYAKRLAEYMAAYPEFTDEFGVKHNTREQLMELMVRYGQRFYQSSSDMIPDTDYYMWAIGVNAKGEFLTPPSLQLYHTQPWVAGNATCEPVMPRYFDGAQILSGEYKDYYVGVLTEVNVTNSDAWYVTVFVGDRTSTDDLPDYRAASTMYNNVPNNPSTYRPRANSRVYVNKNTGATSLRTLMGVAIEKGGEEGATQEARFGPVSRQLFDFNAAGCADPSLFPSNTLGAKSEFAPYSYRPEKVGALIYDAPYGGAVSVTSASAVTGPVSRMALISRDADLDKNDMWRDVTREELRKNQAVRFSHRVR